MNNFVSKLSLYDILSMVIPGGTIFLFLSMTLDYKLKINECAIDLVLGWTIALCLSYLLGLINHICTAIIWRNFRARHMLWRGKERLTKKKVLIIVLFITIMCLIIKCICCFFSSFIDGIWIALFISVTFLLLIINEVMSIRKNVNKDNVLELLRQQYCEAYYYVMKHRYNDNISIIEGQVAFIQNMTLPLALFLFFPPQWILTYLSINECCDIISYFFLFLILFVALILTAFCRQRKIVQLVWEDYEYLKQLEK